MDPPCTAKLTKDELQKHKHPGTGLMHLLYRRWSSVWLVQWIGYVSVLQLEADGVAMHVGYQGECCRHQ